MKKVTECVRNSSSMSLENIEKVEELKNAKFVIETQVKNKLGSWADIPVNIFYQKTPSPGFENNYFGLYYDVWDARLMICDGTSAVSEPIQGYITNDGNVVWSHSTHDFRNVNASFAIDGGRSYTRVVGVVRDAKPVILYIKDGEVFYEDHCPQG